MSNPNCPDCKQAALPRVTKPDNAQNPNRVYYVCQNCPGKDGRGGKFLGWADGKNSSNFSSSAESYKKRKFDEKDREISLASQDPLKTATPLELLLFQKIENIEKMLRGMAPLKKANSEVPNFREKSPLNLYAPELSSRKPEAEEVECY